MPTDLVARWRKSRSPALADQVQRLADEALAGRLAELGRSTAADTGTALKALADLPDDPRLTVALVGWILKPQWPGGTARDGWQLVLARLVGLRDRRAIAPLRAAAAELPLFLGMKHRAWVQQRLAATADALEEACRGIPPAAHDPSLFARPAAKGAGADTLRVVERVWAAPDDDSVRLVAADALQEVSDPWGELIALQFRAAAGQASAADEQRIAALLARNAERFGGPIAHVTKKDAWRFEKGFLVEVAPYRQMVPRLHWEAAAGAPHWATVKVLWLSFDVPRYFVTQWAANPASRRVGEVHYGSYFRRPAPALTLVRDGDAWRIGLDKQLPANARFLKAFRDGLPAEERARMTAA